MHDTVDAQFAWRLPVGFDAEQFMNELAAQVVGPSGRQAVRTKFSLKFRGCEKAWRSDRNKVGLATPDRRVRARRQLARPHAERTPTHR